MVDFRKKNPPPPVPGVVTTTAQAGEKYIVRFPDGMRERIADAAKANNRSMNAEIVERLQQSFLDAEERRTSAYVLAALRHEMARSKLRAWLDSNRMRALATDISVLMGMMGMARQTFEEIETDLIKIATRADQAISDAERSDFEPIQNELKVTRELLREAQKRHPEDRPVPDEVIDALARIAKLHEELGTRMDRFEADGDYYFGADEESATPPGPREMKVVEMALFAVRALRSTLPKDLDLEETFFRASLAFRELARMYPEGHPDHIPRPKRARLKKP